MSTNRSIHSNALSDLLNLLQTQTSAPFPSTRPSSSRSAPRSTQPLLLPPLSPSAGSTPMEMDLTTSLSLCSLRLPPAPTSSLPTLSA